MVLYYEERAFEYYLTYLTLFCTVRCVWRLLNTLKTGRNMYGDENHCIFLLLNAFKTSTVKFLFPYEIYTWESLGEPFETKLFWQTFITKVWGCVIFPGIPLLCHLLYAPIIFLSLVLKRTTLVFIELNTLQRPVEGVTFNLYVM